MALLHAKAVEDMECVVANATGNYAGKTIADKEATAAKAVVKEEGAILKAENKIQSRTQKSAMSIEKKEEQSIASENAAKKVVSLLEFHSFKLLCKKLKSYLESSEKKTCHGKENLAEE